MPVSDDDGSLELYAVAAPGLEPVVAAELLTLGAQDVAERAGGVSFRGDLAFVVRANLWLRSASRVLVVIARSRVTSFHGVVMAAKATPFDDYLSYGRQVNLRVACSKSKLYHERAVAERIHLVIGKRPSGHGAEEPLGIWIRIHSDMMTISVDSSGELLHRRGYREDVAKAPIRENLAAGVLLESGYNGSTPLLDPMCGSGTFVIEAALIAANRAPGINRTFAFEGWPNFDKSLLAAEKAAAIASEREVDDEIQLVGVDRNPGAIAAARKNAERAGVNVTFEVADAGQLGATPGPTGMVISNPPYGHRLNAAHAAMAAIESLRGRFGGWQFRILYASPGPVPRGWDSGLKLRNGGIPVRLISRDGPTEELSAGDAAEEDAAEEDAAEEGMADTVADTVVEPSVEAAADAVVETQDKAGVDINDGVAVDAVEESSGTA
ncbi:MAG: putative N6-adenine-specific DNA methylase [Myxococcota bacterium]|jgi:putative N6-adenine-specific DNA methylase